MKKPKGKKNIFVVSKMQSRLRLITQKNFGEHNMQEK